MSNRWVSHAMAHLENLTCDPSIYTMDHLMFIVSNQKEESISACYRGFSFSIVYFRDILLLETGFLTILVAPFSLQIPMKKYRPSLYHQHDTITMWLVRWLLFRLMFASGVVKLTSRCPTWWGLTGG